MAHSFDPGYCSEPFRTLCAEYPGPEAYPPTDFRVEWGPIFHRGRLDGSARVLVIGQDPAQHETIVRRILIGEAGRRVQGFLAKLGITRSYVMLNTFLYSVFGSVDAAARKVPALIAYRHRWIEAVLAGGSLEAVLTLGTLAAEAWATWKATATGQVSTLVAVAITHPTQPESSSKGDRTKLAAATAAMLQNWNAGLQALAPTIRHADRALPLVLYADRFQDGDRVAIPEADFPAGLPAWMHEDDGWARRVGDDARAKRANITITVPERALP
jgi:uracil-DNA glycosylase